MLLIYNTVLSEVNKKYIGVIARERLFPDRSKRHSTSHQLY